MSNKLINTTTLGYFKTKEDELIAKKVDKETDKGLSTNDYTTDEKNKLAGIATGADVSTITGIQVNGTTQSPVNKIVNITVPTDNKDLNNGAGYQTVANVKTTVEAYKYQTAANVKTTVEAYGYQTAANVQSKIESYGYQTASQVNSAIQSAAGSYLKNDYKVVDALPETGDKSYIYLVKDTHSDSNDAYDEYIWNRDAWEKIGNTDVNLSGYMAKDDYPLAETTDIDALFATT